MAVNTRRMNCTPGDVFAVLENGWLYPTWVVGASRMRAVDDTWPHVGSQLHHSFGSWPVVTNDKTVALQWNPPHVFAMEPRGWPIGKARVTIEVRPHAQGCVVRLTEHAVKGPAILLPKALMSIMLFVRNRETLRRLRFLAEGGAADPAPRDVAPVPGDTAAPPPVRRVRLKKVAFFVAAASVGAGIVRIRSLKK